MGNEPTTCQDLHLPAASRRLPRFLVPVQRLRWHVQKDGVLRTLTKIAGILFQKASGSRKHEERSSMETQEANLGLRPGEIVEVKSLEEINATLDDNHTCRGLGFMPGMERYCGREFPVLKRVEQIVIEGATGKERVRRMKNTVILEGLHCSGAEVGCDRSCFYFWREAWLRRVEVSSLSK